MGYMDLDLTNEKKILSRAARRQNPVNGSLELLPLCNMNCEMCYIRLNKKEAEEQGGLHDVEEWIQLGNEMAEAGVLFLLLTGGEPLMFPGFQRLYQELKRLGMILTINTNGTLLDKGWADFFAVHKPRRINITLYGADDAAYEKLCHYPGGFSKALEAIRLLRERGVDVKINGSVTKYNREDMETIYQIGERLGVPVHMDTYMLPGIHERNLPFDQQARLLPEQAAEAEISTWKREMQPEVYRQYVEQSLMQVEKNEVSYPDQITCLAGNCSFAISWQGKMRPCLTFEEPAVSVFEEGFLSAWQKISESSKGLRVSAACAKCPLRPVCKTCPASAWLETGRYDGMPEYLCRYSKEFVRLLRESVVQIQEDEHG